jgi:hypothetical protein
MGRRSSSSGTRRVQTPWGYDYKHPAWWFRGTIDALDLSFLEDFDGSLTLNCSATNLTLGRGFGR